MRGERVELLRYRAGEPIAGINFNEMEEEHAHEKRDRNLGRRTARWKWPILG
jgi:hypothetical protein